MQKVAFLVLMIAVVYGALHLCLVRPGIGLAGVGLFVVSMGVLSNRKKA
mgnify:CR=1 FL=1